MSGLDMVARGLASRARSAIASLSRTGLYPANASERDIALLTQVATNCRMLDTISGSNKSFTVRSAHRMRASGVTRLAIVMPHWFWDRGTTKLELPTGGGATYRASIEYPEGTLTPLSFDGQVRPHVGDMGMLVSDLVDISIPAGAQFWVRVWSQCSSGTVVFSNYAQNSFSSSSATEKFGIGTGTVTDYSQIAGWVQTAGPSGWWPLAIIAPVAHASVACVGDSKTGGINDVPDASGDMGDSPRSVGATNGYINLGSSGDTLFTFRGAYRRRLQALRFTRNAICGAGVNDIANGRTLAQVQGDMIWLWSLLRTGYGQKVFQLTITPETDSSDNWTTLAGQSAKANFSTAGNGTREQLNDWLRDGAPIVAGSAAATGTASVSAVRAGNGAHPLSAVFDVADLVESGRNSGKWKVDGTAAKWTADGVHQSPYAYQQIGASGVVTVVALTS